MPIVLSSSGIVEPRFKNEVMALFDKPVDTIKLLYITTAIDGETGDTSWVDTEYQSILSLGILEENICEYKINDEQIDLTNFDAIYMLGGNTFYLMDKIREYGFDEKIVEVIRKGVLYIGSSAGSIILGTTLMPAEIFGDEPTSDKQNYDGIGLIDAAIVPHMNKRREKYESWLKTWGGKSYILYDGDGIVLYSI